MNNWFMFLLMMFTGGQMFSMFMEGTTGTASTPLTAAVTPTSTTLNVISTSGFLPENFIIVGDEDICYTTRTATTFTGLTRGCHSNGKNAADHLSGAIVWGEGLGFLNRAISMQQHEVKADDGLIGTVKGKFRFIGVASSWITLIPQMIAWNYSYLDGLGIYLKMILWVLSGGMVFGLFRMLLGR